MLGSENSTAWRQMNPYEFLLPGMTIKVRKREGESVNTLLYRFNKRVQQSGLVREVRKRQFRKRAPNRRKRKDSALYRREKEVAMTRERKFGLTGRDR